MISRSIQRMAEQGPIEMRKFFMAGWAVIALLSVSVLGAADGRAQEMSEKSVRTLMDYAWAITPDRFTKPNGQMVEINRNDPKSAEVPVEAAREVIRVARLSAHAQVCDLKEEHSANYRTMMARETVKKKWSEPQLVYMNQLHMVTVMLLTGQLKVIESEVGKDGKEVQVVEEPIGKKATCSAEQKVKVRDAVAAYLKAGPQLAPADGVAGGPAPGGGAAPAATPVKK